jgi:hypothetical protein
MSWLITGGNTYIPMDSSAASYITAVETADGQVLEPAVRCAIDQFVLGCKTDGIWNAIKASCILAGARTLAGALVPLVGTAPTNVGPFVSGDYNRKTGLAGNAGDKYLNSNRNNNADPQNSQHGSVFVSSAGTAGSTQAYMGSRPALTPGSNINIGISSNQYFFRSRSEAASLTTSDTALGFVGVSRASSAAYSRRVASVNSTVTESSVAPSSNNVALYRTATTAAASLQANARLTFYSIGESLDLALLDARVTTLINAFDAAI